MLTGEVNDFYNKKAKESGWKDFAEFIENMNTYNIIISVHSWTEEYRGLTTTE